MSFVTVWRSWRLKVHDILEVGGDAHPAGRIVNGFLVALIIANGIAFTAETVDSVYARWGPQLDAFNTFSVMVFTVEYVLRLWSSVEIPLLHHLPHWRARLKFAMRPMMIIDLLAILPWYIHAVVPIDLRVLRMLRLFRLLKLVRYSPALQTLKRVVAHEWRALLGALLLMMMLLLFAATMIYFLERDAQPQNFGSIPASAWWALETLTTVGYGDVTPITALGKVFGGIVMLFGLCMFCSPRRHHRHGFQSGVGEARIRRDLEHGRARAAVQHPGRCRGGRGHQAALHQDVQGRRLDRHGRRAGRGDVSDRQRRGHGLRGAWTPDPSARGRFLRRDGAARAAAS